jgi:hypothetical protein
MAGTAGKAKYKHYDASMVWFDDSPKNLWLDLENKNMGIEDITGIFSDLGHDTYLKLFSCSGNISAQDAYSVSKMKELISAIQKCLYKNRTLRMLHMANNNLFLCTPSPQNEHTINYLVKLAEILADSTITKIDLSNNIMIGTYGIQQMGLGVLVRRFLGRQGRGFVCRSNGLHSQSLALIADCMGIYSSMTYLDLSDNCGGLGSFGEPNSNGMFALCTHLRQTPNLKVCSAHAYYHQLLV